MVDILSEQFYRRMMQLAYVEKNGWFGLLGFMAYQPL